MDGRISASLLAFAMSLGVFGCVTTQTQNTINPAGTTVPIDETPVVKKADGTRQPAKAKTEIEFGRLKEADADSEIGKRNPEAQARARDDARKAYQQALKTEPNNVEAMRRLAMLYAKMGDYERAFDEYKKAVAKHPKDVQLWYEMGLAHNRRKEFNQSIPCFQQALKLDPEYRPAQKMLGFSLAYCGKIEEGLGILTRAQGAAMAHYNIARVLCQRGDEQQARQHLQIALRENSQLAEARDLLTQIENPTAPSKIATQ